MQETEKKMLTGNQYVEDLATVSKKQLKTPDDWQNYLIYQPEIATAILKVPDPDNQDVPTINGYVCDTDNWELTIEYRLLDDQFHDLGLYSIGNVGFNHAKPNRIYVYSTLKKGNSVYQGIALPFPTIPENKTYYLNVFETWSYDFAKAYGSAEYAARSFTHMNRFELTAKNMTNKELTQFNEINDNNLISLDRYPNPKLEEYPKVRLGQSVIASVFETQNLFLHYNTQEVVNRYDGDVDHLIEYSERILNMLGVQYDDDKKEQLTKLLTDNPFVRDYVASIFNAYGTPESHNGFGTYNIALNKEMDKFADVLHGLYVRAMHSTGADFEDKFKFNVPAIK